jgi:hypothetical protein
MQPSQPPKLQPSAAPAQSHVAAIVPVPQPVTRTPAAKPSPPAEGGLWVDTTPAGAKVIVDGGSIVRRSPATFSNLAAGKHHLQIVLENYMSEEREIEVKSGEIASQEMIVMRARTESRPAPTPNVVQESPSTPVQKENEQVAAVKKPARNRQSAAAGGKSASPVMRQAVTSAPAPAKSVSKPAPPPKPSVEPKRLQNPFGEGAPGG